MAAIYFVGTYKPIMCGIADYTSFIIRRSPVEGRGVISFNLDKYGVPLSPEYQIATTNVWYGIPDRQSFSAAAIQEGLNALGAEKEEDIVLWFQHEFGIWPNDARFVNMPSELEYTKAVSLHTLHFQSSETVWGLRKREYSFLRSLLPQTDAITVFSDGVYQAVIRAFPEYRDKVHVLRHGIHFKPAIAGMSRVEARLQAHEYLISHSELDKESKDFLEQQRIFLDADTFVIGATGFITASKGTQMLYRTQDLLQRMLPEKKIIAVHAGALREADNKVDSKFAAKLKKDSRRSGQLLLETYLPEDVLSLLLRAFDIYFYWPSDCTQSGIMAHAVGAGATIACRDMEGVGETVKMAGGLTFTTPEEAIAGLQELILNPELREEMSQRAINFAEEFTWRKQTMEHFNLAEKLSRNRYQRTLLPLPAGISAGNVGKTSLNGYDKSGRAPAMA